MFPVVNNKYTQTGMRLLLKSAPISLPVIFLVTPEILAPIMEGSTSRSVYLAGQLVTLAILFLYTTCCVFLKESNGNQEAGNKDKIRYDPTVKTSVNLGKTEKQQEPHQKKRG